MTQLTDKENELQEDKIKLEQLGKKYQALKQEHNSVGFVGKRDGNIGMSTHV